MADNVAVTAGAGTDIASDDIAGVQYQRVKINWGTDGSAVDASATDPLPVTAPAATRATHSIGAALQTDAIMDNLTALEPKFVSMTVTASSTDTTLIAGVTSYIIRVLALSVQCGSSATTSTFESAGSVRKHIVPAGANGGMVLPFNPVGWFQAGQGNSITVTTGTGSSTEITAVYVEVPGT